MTDIQFNILMDFLIKIRDCVAIYLIWLNINKLFRGFN